MKERTRTAIHGLPYKWYTKDMIVELIWTITIGLNQLPPMKGINNRISPFTIMTGLDTLDYSRLNLSYGSYVQFFQDNKNTNGMEPRCSSGLAMLVTQNSSGSQCFLI